MKSINPIVLIIACWLLFLPSSKAQKDSIKYEVGIAGLEATGKSSPFWIQHNQFGKYSTENKSANFSAAIFKDYGASTRLFDYGFKANVLLRTADSEKTEVYFHEAYVKARFSVLDLVVGAREEILGDQDSTLSSGGLLFSTNARPMPKITAGILYFTGVPFTKGYVQFKGAISHGWFDKNAFEQGSYLHHKYIYLRFGGKLPVHLQYGLNHVATWGGNIPGLGKQPTSLNDYKAIFLGKSGGSDAAGGEQINALGNHILSQSLKVEAKVSDFEVNAYWQDISEDAPLRFIWITKNIPDGLWGISIKNTTIPVVKKVLYEYVNTTDQSGPYHDKDGIIYGGADGYFTNYIYHSGWTYQSSIIGTPLISNPTFNSKGELISLNNRVQAHHFGIEGEINAFRYRILTTYSKNYGSYPNPYAEMKDNTSMLVEVNRKFAELANIEVGLSIAADGGKLYGNTWGCMLSIRKSGLIFSRK